MSKRFFAVEAAGLGSVLKFNAWLVRYRDPSTHCIQQKTTRLDRELIDEQCKVSKVKFLQCQILCNLPSVADECFEEKGGGKIGSSASGVKMNVIVILLESSLDSLRALQR